MDIATLLGICSAFGLVFIAIAMGGGIDAFINIPSLMIVLGGTFGATMINYPLKEILGAINVIKNVFFTQPVYKEKIISQFVIFASKARRDGIVALEKELHKIDDFFLRDGLQLSVDGFDSEMIHDLLLTELEAIKNRHKLGSEIFYTMGSFAPAIGMIGTLIGLVQMLQALGTPDTIGSGMALALLTTFYGSVFANLICIPIAGKLRARSKEEILIKEMIIDGIVALTNGDNPRIVEQKLFAYIPLRERKSLFKKMQS